MSKDAVIEAFEVRGVVDSKSCDSGPHNKGEDIKATDFGRRDMNN